MTTTTSEPSGVQTGQPMQVMLHEVLNRLRIKGEVISCPYSDGLRHMKLSAALNTVFHKLQTMEDRLSAIENRLARN